MQHRSRMLAVGHLSVHTLAPLPGYARTCPDVDVHLDLLQSPGSRAPAPRVRSRDTNQSVGA